MSHSIFGRRAESERLPTADTPAYSANYIGQSHRHSDSAIDAALRSVPLPEGLMTRLGFVAYTVSEDSSDMRDWLGC